MRQDLRISGEKEGAIPWQTEPELDRLGEELPVAQEARIQAEKEGSAHLKPPDKLKKEECKLNLSRKLFTRITKIFLSGSIDNFCGSLLITAPSSCSPPRGFCPRAITNSHDSISQSMK